jgi:hypothetical protein
MRKVLALSFIVFVASVVVLPAQSLTLTAPNGGETLTLGQTVQVTWTASNVNQKVKLQLIRGGGALVGLIAKDLNAAPGAFHWTVGQYQGGTAQADGNYKIRVRLQGGDLEDASNGVFAIAAAPAPPAPPTGLNMSQSGIQKKPLTVTAQIVPYAVITSFTVDGKTDASGEKVTCRLSQGMQAQVGAVSKTQPILYRYELTIYENSSGMSVSVKQTPWLEQNAYTIRATLDEVTDAAFPNGMPSTMPFSVFGSIGIEVKNATQSEQPQRRRIQIKLCL